MIKIFESNNSFDRKIEYGINWIWFTTDNKKDAEDWFFEITGRTQNYAPSVVKTNEGRWGFRLPKTAELVQDYLKKSEACGGKKKKSEKDEETKEENCTDVSDSIVEGKSSKDGETIYIPNDAGLGAIPTLKTIKKNLIDLYAIMKNCKTVDDARRIEKELNAPIEINGVWINDFTEGEPIDWFRVEYYKWLNYIYFYPNFYTGEFEKDKLYFDVVDEYGEDFLVDVLPKRLDDEYNQAVFELKANNGD